MEDPFSCPIMDAVIQQTQSLFISPSGVEVNNAAPQIEIHQFDPDMQKIRVELPARTVDAQIELIQALLNKAQFTEPAKRSIATIMNDVGKASNVLGTLDAAQMLAHVSAHWNADFFTFTNTQLEDMQSGLCSSGRATRVFQILQSSELPDVQISGV